MNMMILTTTASGSPSHYQIHFFSARHVPRISAVAFHYCPKWLTAQPRIFPASAKNHNHR